MWDSVVGCVGQRGGLFQPFLDVPLFQLFFLCSSCSSLEWLCGGLFQPFLDVASRALKHASSVLRWASY